MVQTAFPWVFILAIAISAVFGTLPRIVPHARRTTRAILGSFSWLAILSMVAMTMVLLADGSTERSWSKEFFFLVPGSAPARLGIELSIVGTLACWLAAIIFGHGFFAEPTFTEEPSSSQRHGVGVLQGAATLGVAAVALGWFSSGLWTSLLSQVLAGVAGWVVLSHLSSAQPAGPHLAEMSLAYVRERSIAIALVVMGATICSASGASLEWKDLSAGTLPIMGFGLILVGTLLQLQLFPLIHWTTQATGAGSLPSTAQLLVNNPSTWVAFGTLLKMFASGSASAFPSHLVILVLVLPTAVAALAAPQAQGALGHVAASIAGLAVGALVVVGPRVGATFFVVSQLLLWASALYLRKATEGSKANSWEKPIGILLVLALSGGPGFVTAGALLALLEGSGSMLEIALVAATWVVLSLALMRLIAMRASPVAREIADELGIVERVSMGWRVSPAILAAILSLSLLWAGDAVGRFAGSGDSVIGPNWSQELFGNGAAQTGSIFETASWAWMLVLVVMVSAGLPERLSKSNMKFLAIAAEGYRLPRLSAIVLASATGAFEWMGRFFRQRLFPIIGSTPLRWFRAGCAAIAHADRWLLDRLDRAVRGVIEIPAKGLQLMQAGNIQVYLLFTVGFTLALLLHFWSHLTS